jgi:hypothetical protein
MRSVRNIHQPKNVVSHRYLRGLVILTLCAMCASGSVLFAQSGRTVTPLPLRPQAGTNDKNDRVPSPAFIVVTSVPHRFQDYGAHAGYSQPFNLEYHARGGCLLKLRSIPGARVSEDEDLGRWEARETALAEDKAWVIWMELRWDKTTSTFDPTPFRLRYLLFEPRTGRIAASGVGKGVRHTWGKSQSRSTSLAEQLREAGRDIAAQVMSELKIGR